MDSNLYENSKLIDLSKYENLSLNFSKIEERNTSNFFDVSFPPIPPLKNQSIHYRCPQCFNFPLIKFFKDNEEIISYSCACYTRKVIKLEDLFTVNI